MTTIYVTPSGTAIIPMSGAEDTLAEEEGGGTEQRRIDHVADLPEGEVSRDSRTGQWFLNGIEIDQSISTFQDVISRALAAGATETGGVSDSTLATIAENRRQFDETMRIRTEEGNRDFEQQIRAFDHTVANDNELLALNQRRELRAVEEGNKNRALQAQGLILQYQTSIANIENQRAQTVQQAAQFNASMQFAVEQENARRRAENIALVQQNAEMLSEAQQNPSDTAKVVSLLTSRQNAAAGLRAAAERGESGITDESLLPIQELIDTETKLNQGPDLATYNPIAIPEFSPLDTNIPTVGDITGGDIDPELFAAANENGAAVREPDGGIQLPEGSIAQNTGNVSQKQADEFFNRLGMAKGGTGLFMEPTTLKVAENGPELIQGQPLTGQQAQTGTRGSVSAASTLSAPISSGSAESDIFTAGIPATGQATQETTTQATAQTAAASTASAAAPAVFDFGIYGDLPGLVAAVTAENQAGGPGPASALIVQYNAFVTGGSSAGGAPPPDDARKRQQELVDKLLADLGLSDITGAFPIKASAPGTTRFQQRAFQGAFTAGGFGDEELFFELLNRNKAEGVRAGAVGRSG